MNDNSKFGIIFLVGAVTGVIASASAYIGYKELERKGKLKNIKKMVKDIQKKRGKK
jgi:hypothetical protein